jgi:hypothetical protein
MPFTQTDQLLLRSVRGDERISGLFQFFPEVQGAARLFGPLERFIAEDEAGETKAFAPPC